VFVKTRLEKLDRDQHWPITKIRKLRKKSFAKLGSGKTEVESSAHNPQIEGSNPGTVTGREKMAQKEVLQI
jgi:hypothetical protein